MRDLPEMPEMREPTSQEIYRGKLLTLRIQSVPQPIGGTTRFEIVEHPDAVAVVAVRPDPDGRSEAQVALVRQPRPAIGRDTWEIPAGLVKLEDARDPQLTAVRELREETGYVASVWLKLSREYPSPGFSTEAITIYLASGLSRAPDVPIAAADPAYAEVSEVRWVPLREAITLCRDGAIDDGKTVLGLYLAREALRSKSQETTTAATATTGGDEMPRDATNMPNSRPAPFREDDVAAGTSTGRFDPTLKLENMLLEEYGYASQTAYQAMEDRARTFNLYLLIVGVLVSGLGAVYQLQDKVHAYSQPLAIALLLAVGIMGVFFFLQLIRLRQAHRESLVAMNAVKEYYIKHFRAEFPRVEAAFRWRLSTIPSGERVGSITFIICSVIAMLGSLCFGAAAIIASEIALSRNNGLLDLPAGYQPYIVAGAVFVVVIGFHIALYRGVLSRGRELLILAKQAEQLDIPLTDAMQKALAKVRKS